MEKLPEMNTEKYGPKTQSEELGRIDALLTIIDKMIIDMGNSSDKNFDHKKFESLTRQKDMLMIERAHATGSKIDRSLNRKNWES